MEKSDKIYDFVFCICHIAAVISAAPPAIVDVEARYESATVSMTVTTQVRNLPDFHVWRVTPSGHLPDGSFDLGMSAFSSAL